MTPSTLMGHTEAKSVDVRDMLCAQALAIVAKARASLPVGGILDVAYNAADVRHDLLAWAVERKDQVAEPSRERLRIIRQR